MKNKKEWYLQIPAWLIVTTGLLMFVFGIALVIDATTNIMARKNAKELSEVRYTEFSKGWAVGWKAGYCHGKGVSCLAPLSPLAPLPPVGESSYKHGYNYGFAAGHRANR